MVIALFYRQMVDGLNGIINVNGIIFVWGGGGSQYQYHNVWAGLNGIFIIYSKGAELDVVMRVVIWGKGWGLMW